MKQFSLFLFAIVFSLSSNAQVQTVSNQKSIGDLGYIGNLNAAKLADGGFLLSCASTNGVSGDKSTPSFGSEDIWIIRVDANYNIIWQKSLGGSGNEHAFMCVETPEGNLLIGGTSSSPISGNKTVGTNGGSDFWLIKLTADGNVIWQKNYGGTEVEILRGIETVGETRYLLAGSSNSNISGDKTEANRGISDVWTVMIDSAGTILWEKTIGGDKIENLKCVKFDSQTNHIILGTFSDSFVFGDKTTANFGQDDIWLIKLDLNGQIVQQTSLGGNLSDFIQDMIQIENGDFIVIGSSNSPISGNKIAENKGQSDFWIIRITQDFEIVWDKTYGGESVDGGNVISFVSPNNYTIAGSSSSNMSEDKSEDSKGDLDIWVIAIDSTGTKLWDKTIGGSSVDGTLAFFQKSPNNFAVFAVSESGISGDKTAPNRGMFHFWMFDLTTTLGIDALEQTNFTVYPNPAHNWIHVPFVDNKPTVFTVTDASGRIVDSGVLTATQLDVSTFQNGMYTLQLLTDDQVLVSRFVVQR